MIVVYNDGEVAVQLFEDGVGSIQRCHRIGGQVIEQASKEKFLEDLPVCQAFIDDIKAESLDAWNYIEKVIKEVLEDRKRSR